MKMGYAGRLDPMAEGLVLYMVGDENKKRDHYQKLDKEYHVDVLFGFSTDSYDILGEVEKSTPYKEENVTEELLGKILSSYVGLIDQPYPPFSSKRVNGKPLYYWAHHNLLNGITIPSEKREIYSIALISMREISKKELKDYIVDRISRVKGNFRQKEIMQVWEDSLSQSDQDDFVIARLSIHCASGTYMRSLAHMIGDSIGLSACAFSIERTRIGSHRKADYHIL